MEEAIEAGFEAIVVTVDAPPGGNRERDRRNGFTLPQELGTPSLDRRLGGERALTIEETFALMNHALDLGRRRGPRLRVQRPGPGQGRPHRRGRRAGARARRRRRRRLQPRRPPARPLRSPPPTRCRRSPSGRRPRHACWSTAASAAASTSPPRSPSAPTRCWSAGPPSGASPPPAAEGVAARPRSCSASELELTLGLCGCTSPAELTRAHVRRAPLASVYSV